MYYYKIVRVTITQKGKDMHDIKETIGENIRIIRKSKGMTLKDLSRLVDISHQQLSRIENGLGTSTITLQRISTVLGIDMSKLLEEPESTLQSSISRTQDFVPENFCKQMYAHLYEDVIKPTNDIVIDKFMEELIDKVVHDQGLIRNRMCMHAGDKEVYEFSPSELLSFSEKMFVDFADFALRLSRNELDNDI